MRQARTRQVWMAATVLVTIGAAPAAAQVGPGWTDRAFVNVNVGSQTSERRVDITGGFPIYDEDASYETSLATRSGAIFDLSGGVRVFRNVAVGVGFSRYGDSHNATVTGVVPDPLFFDMPHSSAVDVSGLDHTETTVHLSAAYVLPLMERLNVMVFGGPSFFSLDKDILDSVSVIPGGSDLADATTRSVSGSATGAHIGVDVSYEVLRTAGIGLGVGGFLRQSGGSVDVREVTGGDITVGGLNLGVGARIRY